MPRSKGTQNTNSGKTYFFGDVSDTKSSEKVQVEIHHDTSNHWSVVFYINGTKQERKERISYLRALELSGLDPEDFDNLYGRTSTARFRLECRQRLEEIRASKERHKMPKVF